MEECKYSPQISPGNPNILPMPDVIPITLVEVNHIELGYPFANPTLILNLRNPELGDKYTKKYSRIQRYSRGNTLVAYRDSNWPKTNYINYSFRGLSKNKAEEALEFYRTSAGKYIRLTTYEGILYKGIIINPNNPISQEGVFIPDSVDPTIDVGCNYTLKLDFQGEIFI